MVHVVAAAWLAVPAISAIARIIARHPAGAAMRRMTFVSPEADVGRWVCPGGPIRRTFTGACFIPGTSRHPARRSIRSPPAASRNTLGTICLTGPYRETWRSAAAPAERPEPCRLPIGEGELRAKRDERTGEGTAHPGQHLRTGDHVIANRGSE